MFLKKINFSVIFKVLGVFSSNFKKLQIIISPEILNWQGFQDFRPDTIYLN